NLTYENKLSVETEYSETNYWLEWVRYSALLSKVTIVFALARPHLGTVPFPIDNKTNPAAFFCLTQFSTTQRTNYSECTLLQQLYPPHWFEKYKSWS
ncbi:hypothetical protein PRIEUP_LOCUS92, partial [Pristimantis euphronides]